MDKDLLILIFLYLFLFHSIYLIIINVNIQFIYILIIGYPMIQNFQFSFLDFLTKYANIASSATAQPGIIRRIAIIAAIISMTGV